MIHDKMNDHSSWWSRLPLTLRIIAIAFASFAVIVGVLAVLAVLFINPSALNPGARAECFAGVKAVAEEIKVNTEGDASSVREDQGSGFADCYKPALIYTFTTANPLQEAKLELQSHGFAELSQGQRAKLDARLDEAWQREKDGYSVGLIDEENGQTVIIVSGPANK